MLFMERNPIGIDLRDAACAEFGGVVLLLDLRKRFFRLFFELSSVSAVLNSRIIPCVSDVFGNTAMS